MLLFECREKVLDREYLCMYVGSTSMPTVVELNGTESKVHMSYFAGKINYLRMDL